jgi:trimethylamine--corrinoid protein Co-methyltransferase
LKGITVDTEHLALEVIDTVGPGGNFITADHTLAHLHTEYFRGNSVTDQKRSRQVDRGWIAGCQKTRQ